MKHLFRFHRGELNGFFINALCTFLNKRIISKNFKGESMMEELTYAFISQWVDVKESRPYYVPLRDDDVMGIALIGGLFPLNAYFGMNLGSIWFTPRPGYGSPIGPNGVPRAERGLVRADYADFMFVRIDDDDYPPRPVGGSTLEDSQAYDAIVDDITNDASAGGLANGDPHNARLITYVKHNADVQGYVRADMPLFDTGGNVIWGNLLKTPPVDIAYSAWYGLKYLHFEQIFRSTQQLPIDVFKPLFECMQVIRRNGVSIKSLFDITWLLGQGYITGLEINRYNYWFDVQYSLDTGIDFPERERMFAAWQVVMDMKFKEFVFRQKT